MKLLVASILTALMAVNAALADAPVVWSGSTAKWLPAGLRSAGVCKLASTGVMTSGTVADGELANSYLYANGSRALSSAWNAGQNITAPSFIGALTGNADTATTAATATALAANPTDCGAGSKATAIDASGNLTCSAVSLTADVSGTLPVGNGGTGTGTAFTQGSVVFAGGSGIYTQDNAELFYDATNDRLGLGTAVPSGTLDITNVDDSIRGNLVMWGQGRNPNSEWLHYVSATGDISIYQPNQAVYGWGCRATGGCSFGTYSLGSGNQMLGIKNNAGETAKSTLAMELLASQTGDFLTAYANGQGSVLAKITAAGAGTFAGMTVSTLGAGVVHSNGSGVLSSSAVNLAGGASEVSGTLPVGNGGTGITSGTSGGVLYYSGSSTIASSSALSQYQVVLGGGAGGAPNVVSGTGTSGQVLTSNGAGANPTWQDATGGSGSIDDNCVLDTGAATANGTTNTTVRNFANANDTGTGCTSDNSSTANGSKITIDTAGLWSITYTDNRAGGSFEICITKNSTGLSTQCRLITASQRLQQVAGTTDRPAHVTWVGRFAVNDVIRAQNDTNASDTTSYVKLVATRIGD